MLSGLVNFAKLETLNLYNAARIGDEAIPLLSSLKSLRWLDLTATSVTATGLAKLKASNPNCTVLWEEAAMQKPR